MCTEYVVRWIDGEWRWVVVRSSKRNADRQGSFDFSPRDFNFTVRRNSLAPVVRLNAQGETELVEMRWGFPSPVEDERDVVNVRNYDKPFWKPWLAEKWRCLVPVTEFNEVTEGADIRKVWFKLMDKTPFMFAGIYRPANGKQDADVYAMSEKQLLFAILTTEANNVVRAIHPNAMPVLITPDKWMEWLTEPWETVRKTIVKPHPDSEMDVPR